MPIFHFFAVLTTIITGMIHPVSHAQTKPISPVQVLADETKFIPTVTPIPSPTLSPLPVHQTYRYSASVPHDSLVDCVGPDGKHLHVSQKACEDFNSAWHTSAVSPFPTSPYGQATKIADHTYELKLPPDSTMATPQEILAALNSYRRQHDVSQLSWSDTLAAYAQSRANAYTSKGALDAHAGFMDFVNNQDGFKKLGFNHLGENAAYAGPLNGSHLIEWVFAADEEHNSNQLNSGWTNVGIGVSGVATDIIFGSSPL